MSVPAWKRLGLKLKGSSDASTPTPSPASVSTSTPIAPPKRKFDSSASGSNNTPLRNTPSASSFKKPRTDAPSYNVTATPDRRKSVSFTTDTNTTPRATSSIATPAKKPKKPKAPKLPGDKKPVVKQVTTDITPSLEYIRLWKTARNAWKFNKNHQTLLAKYIYQRALVPAEDAVVFYKYIRDMAGYARERLLTSAREVVRADMESVTGEFPAAGTPAEAPTAPQMAANARYHVRLAEVSRTMDENKIVDEKALVSETEDKSMVKRLIRRVRADAVIAALEGSERSEKAVAAVKKVEEAKEEVMQEEVEAEEKVEEVANPAVTTNGKKTRARKKRVMADSDSSSSESESDSSDSDSD